MIDKNKTESRELLCPRCGNKFYQSLATAAAFFTTDAWVNVCQRCGCKWTDWQEEDKANLRRQLKEAMDRLSSTTGAATKMHEFITTQDEHTKTAQEHFKEAKKEVVKGNFNQIGLANDLRKAKGYLKYALMMVRGEIDAEKTMVETMEKFAE